MSTYLISYCSTLQQKRTSNSPDLFNMMSGNNNNTSSGGVAHSTSNSNLNEMEDIEITGTFERFFVVMFFLTCISNRVACTPLLLLYEFIPRAIMVLLPPSYQLENYCSVYRYFPLLDPVAHSSGVFVERAFRLDSW